MFSSNQKSSVQPRNGGITFGKPARGVYNDASATYETSNFTRSSHRANLTLSYTKPSYLSKPAVNASANIPQPEDPGNHTRAVAQVILRKGCTVELRGIPNWVNTIAQLDSHFSEYGRLMDITVCYQGDPGAATVTFSNHAEVSVAQRSTNMGFTNGSWSFKAPNKATVPYTSHRRGTYKMPPVDIAQHKFIRKEENKVEDLQKRKQELLEQYSKQLKALKDIVAKCGPNDPAREGKFNMIKGLMSSMESIKASVSIAGVRQQAKVHIERKPKVRDNAVVKQISPTNNQLSTGQSEVPADKEQWQNFVNKLNKVGSDNIEAQTKIGASYPKLSTQLNDVTIVHASSTSVIHSLGSLGISYEEGSLRVEEIANVEQLGQATVKDTLDYSLLDYEYEYPDLSGDWE